MNEKPKTEDQILAAAVKKIWNELPETRYCFYHIANEAKRSVMEWAQLKAKGFTAGIQDLHFLFGGHTYLIEMKDEKGQIQPDQAVVHCAHFNQGFPTYIFRNETDLFNFVHSVVNHGHADTEQAYAGFRSKYCLPIENLPELVRIAREKKNRKYKR